MLSMYRAVAELFQRENNLENNNQVIVHPQANLLQDHNNDLINRKIELSSNLERTVKELNPEISSFEESFPDFNPQEDILPVSLIKYLSRKFHNLGNTTLDEVKISDKVNNNLDSSDTIIENVTGEVSNSISKVFSSQSPLRPLGEAGETTLNQIIVNLHNYKYQISGIVDIYPTKIISAGFIYTSIVNSYAKTVFPLSHLNRLPKQEQEAWLITRRVKLTRFMLGPAPAITLLLYLITNKSVFDAVKITDVEVNIQKSLMTLLLFTPKAIKQIKGFNSYSTSNLNNHNNNKFKFFISIIIFIIFLLFVSDLNSLLVLLSGLTVKGLVNVYCIIACFFIFSNLLEILLMILFHKNLIKVPLYLPLFIFNWLNSIKNKSSKGVIQIFLDSIVKDTVIHVFCLFIIYFLSSFL